MRAPVRHRYSHECDAEHPRLQFDLCDDRCVEDRREAFWLEDEQSPHDSSRFSHYPVDDVSQAAFLLGCGRRHRARPRLLHSRVQNGLCIYRKQEEQNALRIRIRTVNVT